MAIVNLRHPLRGLADEQDRVEVEGEDLLSVVRGLETRYPAMKGWVLDEAGAIRQHVSLFVRGETAKLDEKVGPDDEVFILHAISGGAGDTAELLVGTRKGLFVLRGERGGQMEVAQRAFEGLDVEFAMRDPRTGTYIASVTHGQFGPHLYWTEDPLGKWNEADGPRFPEDSGATLVRTWIVTKGEADGVLWAGVDPAALFKSEDSGRSWQLVRGLWDQPSRPDWQPGGGGLALHSICTWPGNPDHVTVGISAAGIWHTDDGGATWRRGGKGIVPRYLPEDAGEEDKSALCIHNMHRAPLQPETLYMQFHGGVYRSDDAGENWSEIGLPSGLPSDFGFPLVDRSGRSRLRLRDSADRRPRPRDRRGPGNRLRDTRPGRLVERANRRIAGPGCIPNDPEAIVLPGRELSPRSLLRGNLGRGVRFRRRRCDVGKRDARPASCAVGALFVLTILQPVDESES